MNCPKCKTGILEEAGDIHLTPSLSKDVFPISLNVSKEKSLFQLSVYICSLDICSHTVLKANKEFLAMIKEEKCKFYEKEKSEKYEEIYL